MQACDFLGDRQGFVGEARTLALQLLHMHANCSAAALREPTGDLLGLQHQQLQAVLQQLAASAPLNLLLTKLPALLQQLLLQGLMRAECSGDADAAHHLPATPLCALALDAPGDICAARKAGVTSVFTAAACQVLTAQLPTLPQLKSFSAQRHSLSDDALAALIAAARMHTQLTHISLAGSGASTMAAHSLSMALLCWRALRQLHVDGVTAVSEQALQHVADGLTLLTGLQTLHIGSSAAWAQACAGALSALTTLRSFEASGKSGNDPDGVYEAVAQLTGLTHLKLCGVGDVDMQSSTSPLSQALQALTGLQELLLSSDFDAVFPGARLTKLQHLELHNFSIDVTLVAAPLGAIPPPAAAPLPAPAMDYNEGLRSLASMQQLTHLAIGSAHIAPSLAFVHALGLLVAHAPALRAFELHSSEGWYQQGGYEHMSAAWACARALTSLTCRVRSVSEEEFAPQACHLLRILRLDTTFTCDDVTAPAFAANLARMSQLTYLAMGSGLNAVTGGEDMINDRNAIADRTLINACAGLTNLQTLKLSGLILHMSAIVLEDMFKALPGLQHFSVHECSLPLDFGWLSWLQPRAKFLSVSVCVNEDGEALRLYNFAVRLGMCRGFVIETDLTGEPCKLPAVLELLTRRGMDVFRWLRVPQVVSGRSVEADVAEFNRTWVGQKFAVVLSDWVPAVQPA